MQRFYFTFGSSEQYPYTRGQYVIVIAEDYKDAALKFKEKYPNPVSEAIPNCAFYYAEDEWNNLIAKNYEGKEPADIIGEEPFAKLRKYGYKEEKIKARTMSMAELRIGTVQELLKMNYRYANIRLVNMTLGEVDSYDSTEEFLLADYHEAYEIELISIKEVLYYEESEGCSKIRIIILVRETEGCD